MTATTNSTILDYRKKILLLIVITTALRLFFASSLELGADETYYWSFALKLQGNYFDHPPIVAFLIRLTTFNLLFHNELAVRVGAIISSAVCTWIIFKLGTLVNNQQTGWFAALLYNASIYCSIVAGMYILPDSPQLIFWLTSLLIFIKISRLTDDHPKSTFLWCMFGITTGLCIMSKVHGVFLWFGVLLYLLFFNRNSLKYRGIYLSALITLIIISPIIIWNFQNDFISYRFHSGRVSPTASGLDLLGFLKAFSQEAQNVNPINFVLIIISLFSVFRGKLPVDKKDLKILLFCSLPLILTILILSLFRETFPHWSGPAYSCLLILPAIKLSTVSKNKTRYVPGVIIWALGYMVMVACLQIVVIDHFPGTVSTQKEGPKTGTNDVTLDMYEWKETGEKFDSLYKSDVAKKIMPDHAPIIVTNWSPASTIEFYIANKTKQEVIGIGDVFDLHQYYWSDKYKKQLKNGDDAYYIVPSDSFSYRTFNEVNQRFKGYTTALVIPQYRSGFFCRSIAVYRMIGYTK